MANASETIVISLPSEHATEFKQFWKELRIADALPPEFDLDAAIEMENFDGSTVVKWIMSLSPKLIPLVTVAVGYLIAARGEIEIERNGERIKVKNLKPSNVREFLAMLDDRSAGSGDDPSA